MTVALWIGLALVVLGLAGLGWCILRARALARGTRTPEETRAEIARLTGANAAAVGIAFFGLGLMLLGVLL